MFIANNIYRSVGQQHILKGVSLQIQPGEAVALVGPNGCGKTSFLNTINGFNQVDEGTVMLGAVDITHFSVEKRAQQGIGRVFQSSGIFESLTLYENLALAYVKKLAWKYKLLPLRFLPAEVKEAISEILHNLDLYHKKDELAGNLSGGQMRLLEIARLSLQDTTLYLLDEPTAGVSPDYKEKVITLLQALTTQGKMVLIVEHDREFLDELVDRVCVMEAGQIVTKARSREIV